MLWTCSASSLKSRFTKFCKCTHLALWFVLTLPSSAALRGMCIRKVRHPTAPSTTTTILTTHTPVEVFENRRRYGLQLRMSRHPELNKYIYNALDGARPWMKKAEPDPTTSC